MASINHDVSIPNKKAKLDNCEDNKGTIHDELTDLTKFHPLKVLHNNSNRKIVCLTGHFTGAEGTSIILLEKSAFEEKQLNEDFFSNCALKQIFQNDIYGTYECSPKVELNTIKTTVIHPASQKHIDKYRSQTVYIIDETPEIYTDVVLPHLNQEQLNLQWVYNILEHKSEEDRIVFEIPGDSGFILLPDLKWDGKTIETLYLLALPHLRDIKSIRELNDSHLPLLRSIYKNGVKAIHEKYGLDASRLRIYFHYQPSFYHLHVHFTYLQYDAPGIFAERAHLLANVISNIELVPDYYQRVTLPFVVRENDGLFKKLEDRGLLTKHGSAQRSA